MVTVLPMYGRYSEPCATEPLIHIRMVYTTDKKTVFSMNATHGVFDGGTTEAVLGLLMHFCKQDGKVPRPPYSLDWERQYVVPEGKKAATLADLKQMVPNILEPLTWWESTSGMLRLLWSYFAWKHDGVSLSGKTLVCLQREWGVSAHCVLATLIGVALTKSESCSGKASLTQVVNVRARRDDPTDQLQLFTPTYVGNAVSHVRTSLQADKDIMTVSQEFASSFHSSLKAQEHYEDIINANNAERLGVKPGELDSNVLFAIISTPGAAYLNNLTSFDFTKVSIAGHRPISFCVAAPGFGRMFCAQRVNRAGDVVISTILPYSVMTNFKREFQGLLAV